MPKLRQESFGPGDQSWLASPKSLYEARTETVDVSAFTPATHFPDGFLPSGTPVAKVSGLLVPYVSAEGTTTGAGVLAGHLLTDQPVVGTQDFAAPLIDSGRVKAAKIPHSFTKPVAAAKRADTTIVYI